MKPTYHTIGSVLSVLIIGSLLFTARVYASPVQQSLTLEELTARVVSLEQLVAAQNEQIESLNARVAELECALESARCEASSPTVPEDWGMGVSSDTILRYRYSPAWELTNDEPGVISFEVRSELQIVSIYWMRLRNSVEDLVADEVELHNYEAELLEQWTLDDEKSEIMSTSVITLAGKPALLWEFSFTGGDDFNSRMLNLHYDCGEVYVCEVALRGLDREFRSEDHNLVRTLMSTLEIVTGSATVARNANLRACPGLSCDVIGRAVRGQIIEIIGQSEDGDWYQIASGEWISASLVDGAPEDIPVISDSANA